MIEEMDICVCWPVQNDKNRKDKEVKEKKH
jgi:hypothetical protein